MALGGVVHDGVVAGDQPVEQLGVADVAHDELHAVGRQTGDVLGVAGVGQLVQDGDVDVRVVVDHVVHEVAADEAAAARDDDIPRHQRLNHCLAPFGFVRNRYKIFTVVSLYQILTEFTQLRSINKPAPVGYLL